MNTRWIIGLVSGSSLQGVDAALVEIEGLGANIRLQLRYFLQLPYSQEVRELLTRAGSTTAPSLRNIALSHRLLGESFAAAARQVVDDAKFNLQQVF